jgi:hypothetical protein
MLSIKNGGQNYPPDLTGQKNNELVSPIRTTGSAVFLLFHSFEE